MKKLNKTTRSNMITYGIVIVAFVIMQLLVSGGKLSNSLSGQLVPICVYICMAVSLNLTGFSPRSGSLCWAPIRPSAHL